MARPAECPYELPVTIRLPKKPKIGVLSIPFRLSPRGGSATGTGRGKFTVLRS
jgi:hypothetical protein